MSAAVLSEITQKIGDKSERAWKTFCEDLRKIPIMIDKPQKYERKTVSQTDRIENSPKSPSALQQKKKSLLKQLNTIQIQLRRKNVQNSRLTKKTEKTMEDEITYVRASELIQKMKKRRHEVDLLKKKKSQALLTNVKRSMQVFEEINHQAEMKKQKKRERIEERIQNRKNKLRFQEEYNKKANQLICELQSHRVSLPPLITLKTPEQNTEKSESSLRRYPKSCFYDKIEEQEMKKKREKSLKEFEKKKIRERQQLYGKKTRNNLQDSSVFVTNSN